MAIKRIRKDPRSAAEQRADKDLLRSFERGKVLQVQAGVVDKAVEHVLGRRADRRDLVALLGRELGVLRRAHGLSQEAVAHAVGTNKSNISRLESGRYGGLTVERFIAVLEAFDALGRQRSA